MSNRSANGQMGDCELEAMPMKILMLTPYLPYPLLSGGQIRTYNLLKNLSKKHEITLFSLIKDEREKKYIAKIQPFCREVQVFKRPKNPWALRNVLLAGFTPYPFVVTRNLPIGAKGAIAKALRKGRFDLIHAETFYMMPNIPRTKIPILLVEQTIEYLGYQSYVRGFKLWPLKPLLYLDVLKIYLWEKYFWNKANRLVTMSDEDKRFISKILGKEKKIDVVANGVDMDFFSKTRKKLSNVPTVLFVGTFKWLPNVHAVKILVEEIWPKIKEKAPNAKLKIVGFSPTKEIMSFSRVGEVEVVGQMTDIRKAYATSHVLVAPIFSGKGTRYKVLEAMATGTPIVSSHLAVEGIEITPGREALVSDNFSEIARLTVKLLKDEKLQVRLAEAGRKLVRENYDWQIISKELDRIYQELGHGKD